MKSEPVGRAHSDCNPQQQLGDDLISPSLRLLLHGKISPILMSFWECVGEVDAVLNLRQPLLPARCACFPLTVSLAEDHITPQHLTSLNSSDTPKQAQAYRYRQYITATSI